MRLIHSAKIIPAFAAIAFTAFVALSTGGCGSADTPTTPEDEVGGSQIITESFTLQGTSYIRRQVTEPGQISFTIKGIDDGEPDNRAIVYFYDEQGYTGGVGGYGFEGELRNMKMKWYDIHGDNISENYHGVDFNEDQSYDIVLEWGTDFIKCSIDGNVINHTYGTTASTFTLGIGYPPAGLRDRGGFDGATYTNVIWPAGSTEIP